MNGYLQWGHGPRKVLLLNGWFGSSSDWLPMVDALELDTLSFVAFDYRGYGRSMDIDGEFTFDEAARDVTALADHLGWERFSLVGHSMGGMAMQRALLAMPGRIERLVAVTAVPACGARMDELRLAMFRKAVKDLHTRKAIIDASTGKRLPQAWISHVAQQSWNHSMPEAFGCYLEEWAAQDFSEQVKGNPTPLKVIVGEHDPSLNTGLMECTWLRWYPDAVLESLQDAGHYPMHEVPLALAASIQAFLQQ